MKLNLLEITQLILSDMDSDEVNSISDTPEAQQVASIIKETYIDIISRADLPEHYSLFELNESGNITYPCVMRLPADVLDLIWVKYNNYDPDLATPNPYYKEVQFMDLKLFMDRMYALNADENNIVTAALTVGTDSIDLVWQDNKFPSFYTTYNDHTILFDSYQATQDDTLMKNKTVCYGLQEPTFTMTDTFTPDLDSKQFSLLIQESKSQAFLDLKQVANTKSEARARKGWLNMQRQSSSFPDDYYNNLPNYSRKG